MPDKTKILVAEDDADGAHFLRQTLTKLGYEVIGIVSTGKDIIRSVDLEQPDLILMDISLGGQMDGIAVAENLHARHDIPVIFLTGHTDDTLFQRAKTIDAYAYLTKPYEISQLKHSIEIALWKHNFILDLKNAEKKISALNCELNSVNSNLVKEIAERKKVEKLLRHQAHHDALTGLPNRLLLFELLKQSFAFEDRHNSLLALMLLDLDNFKTVNDTMGHLAGDMLLKKIAKRLQECMRQYDTVGRLGGDEFVIVANDIHTIQDIVKFAEKVLDRFQQPIDILGRPIQVTASIGVAVYPLHGSNAETLLKMADLAMYAAKNDGRNSFRFFSETMKIKDKSRGKMLSRRNSSLKPVKTFQLKKGPPMKALPELGQSI